ncbi:hypothetical protein JXB02_04930 [Candidatus Woesearchaeota archaeon]|nr:hypothetical protein [Candidatus Woesearchaeota archaeon]
MADFDAKSLEKLSPAERIAKLKDLEKTRKEEQEEIARLLKKSEEERRRQIEEMLDDVEVPDEVDLESRFRPDDEESLDAQVETEAPEAEEEHAIHSRYQTFLARQAFDDLYSNIVGMASEASEAGYTTPDMMGRAVDMAYAIRQKQDDIARGAYNSQKLLDEQMDAAKRILDMVMGMYKPERRVGPY